MKTKLKIQLSAVDEHAEAFAMYLIQGKYKINNEMSLYYQIVAKYWQKCYDLKCESRDVKDIFGLVFVTKGKYYMKRFEECGFL